MSHPYDRHPNVPILGQKKAKEVPANQQDLTGRFEVYDSEIIKIEKVLERLKASSTGHRDYESFNREIKERFAEIGFVVSVKWFEFAVGGQKQDGYMPEVEITGRTEHHTFDHDRMVSEVTGDLLGLGEGGVIKTDPGLFHEGNSDGHAGHGH